MLARITVEGSIRSLHGSIGDRPAFVLATDHGTLHGFDREGDVSRYATGLRVRVAYVAHAYKRPEEMSPDTCCLVLAVELEDLDRPDGMD